MDTVTLDLKPEDNHRLQDLCGNLDEHLHMIERHLAIEINHRGHHFKLIGPQEQLNKAETFLNQLYQQTENSQLATHDVNMGLHELSSNANAVELSKEPSADETVKLRQTLVRPRGDNQRRYIKRIGSHDINFAIGPAGTGKTFLAIACAVEALESERVQKIILVRPAVEAGENLGFLPGDLAQKVDPYLRPMYDALYALMGIETVVKLIERSVIEVAPLAYMRGRTLNDAFIVLDESQNTTKEQMKMFLTRIGFNSTAVVTGDITQVDLPRGKTSGLRHVINILVDVEGISFTFFHNQDVIRHPLVQKVVTAYDQYEKKHGEQ